MGINEENGIDYLYAWRKKLAAYKPVPVNQLEGGPVLENQMAGNDVDLYKFPVPNWHDLDGGPYIGTGCGIITKDPETGAVNIGTYRVMVQDKNHVSVKMNMGKHGRLAFERARDAGKSLPVAITLCQGPAVFLAAQMPLPPDVNEFEFAGYLQGSPVPVVRGAATGLPIPANAEIVLEGEILPMKDEEMPKEGPFGEWPGYFTEANVGETPLMEVKRVYYRNNPILLGAPPLKPPSSYLPIPLGAATLWEQLEKAGIPEVKGVWGFVYGGQPGPFTVVSIKQRYAGPLQTSPAGRRGRARRRLRRQIRRRGRRRYRYYQSRPMSSGRSPRAATCARISISSKACGHRCASRPCHRKNARRAAIPPIAC